MVETPRHNSDRGQRKRLKYPCSSCGKFIVSHKDARRHPILNTLQCITCHNSYELVGDLSKYSGGVDLNAQDNYCAWCTDGGELVLCSDENCHVGFCYACIDRNFGESKRRVIISKKDWYCFVCDYKQLSQLVKQADNALQALKARISSPEVSAKTQPEIVSIGTPRVAKVVSTNQSETVGAAKPGVAEIIPTIQPATPHTAVPDVASTIQAEPIQIEVPEAVPATWPEPIQTVLPDVTEIAPEAVPIALPEAAEIVHSSQPETVQNEVPEAAEIVHASQPETVQTTVPEAAEIVRTSQPEAVQATVPEAADIVHTSQPEPTDIAVPEVAEISPQTHPEPVQTAVSEVVPTTQAEPIRTEVPEVSLTSAKSASTMLESEPIPASSNGTRPPAQPEKRTLKSFSLFSSSKLLTKPVEPSPKIIQKQQVVAEPVVTKVSVPPQVEPIREKDAADISSEVPMDLEEELRLTSDESDDDASSPPGEPSDEFVDAVDNLNAIEAGLVNSSVTKELGAPNAQTTTTSNAQKENINGFSKTNNTNGTIKETRRKKVVDFALRDGEFVKKRLKIHLEATKASFESYDENRFKSDPIAFQSWLSNVETLTRYVGLLASKCNDIQNFMSINVD